MKIKIVRKRASLKDKVKCCVYFAVYINNHITAFLMGEGRKDTRKAGVRGQ